MAIIMYDYGEAQFNDVLNMTPGDRNSGVVYSGSVLNNYIDPKDNKHYWTLGNGSGVTLTGTLDYNDDIMLPGGGGGKCITPYIKGVIQGTGSTDMQGLTGEYAPLPGTLYISYDTENVYWMNSERTWQQL